MSGSRLVTIFERDRTAHASNDRATDRSVLLCALWVASLEPVTIATNAFRQGLQVAVASIFKPRVARIRGLRGAGATVARHGY